MFEYAPTASMPVGVIATGKRADEVALRDRRAVGTRPERDDLGRELVTHHVVAARIEHERRARLGGRVSTSWSA